MSTEPSPNLSFDEVVTIHINDIRLIEATQPRATINEETVADYAERMEAGDKFPPIVVFANNKGDDGKLYWLGDGFHRVHACIRNDFPIIEAVIRHGGLRDAILYSVSANATHGLPRNQADKRRAVERLLRDDEWRQWSDREIARWCQVSDKTVGKVRAELVATAEIPQLENRRYVRDGHEQVMNTAGIGADQGQRPEGETARTASTSPTHPGSWLSAWEEHKRKHPDLVLFPRVGRSHTLWIALDEDAQRVGRILGVEPRQFPYAEGWKTAIKLWVPEPHPAWFDGLYQALEGNVLAYSEADPQLKSIADTLIPTALIIERDPAAVNVSGTVAPASSGASSLEAPSEETPPVTEAPWYGSSGDNGGSYEWYTPPEIVERVKRVLGGHIGLDPASCEEANQVVNAHWFFGKAEDGLRLPWETGTLYLNPPYGAEVGRWIEKLVEEYEAGRFIMGLVLLPHRSETAWFNLLRDFPRCHIRGRLQFWGPANNGSSATFPSVIVGINVEVADFAEAFEDLGDIYVRYVRDRA